MEQIKENLNKRKEFLNHLKKDVEKNKSNVSEVTSEIDRINNLIQNMEFLNKQPQWNSLIPMGKRIYMTGTVNHTGEYLLEKPGYPYNYSYLATKDQTIKSLNNRLEVLRKNKIGFDEIIEQLEKRINIIDLGDDIKMSDQDMPEQIISDQGIAVKVGEFYEIIEYENDKG